jgi:hypothetical protein
MKAMKIKKKKEKKRNSNVSKSLKTRLEEGLHPVSNVYSTFAQHVQSKRAEQLSDRIKNITYP